MYPNIIIDRPLPVAFLHMVSHHVFIAILLMLITALDVWLSVSALIYLKRYRSKLLFSVTQFVLIASSVCHACLLSGASTWYLNTMTTLAIFEIIAAFGTSLCLSLFIYRFQVLSDRNRALRQKLQQLQQ